ncbi:MptD family putative ECF transporter S component [Clostridium tagluense]|uniref:MptD family putative ECF transporter S component n=1 Tax=Clostridium tagluense TaxID=360422 RepID=UPI001C0E34E6|nr:MptD family putative ECF transporter S component [Clostridium tagluense]MBU3130402.1 MptD family putative ECF transporter S component [Clostridium tagluense]
MKNNSNKLQGKDLINVGIFTAIYFVIVFAVAMLGYIPILMPLLCVLVPIIGGIPFMLFLTKVKRFGMVLIMSIIIGNLMLLTGMGYYALIVGTVSGLVAELVLASGKYKSTTKAVLTSGIFSIWVWGNFVPFFTDIKGYFATRQDFGQEYINKLTSYMTGWMCPTLLVAAFVSGIIGGFLGRAVLKKHFTKAGIA